MPAEGGLYERDFCLWVEEQVRLLRAGTLEHLNLVNLVEETEGLGIGERTPPYTLEQALDPDFLPG